MRLIKSHLNLSHLFFHHDKSSIWAASMISSLSAIFDTATSTKSFASATISLEHVIGSSENTIGFVTENGSASSSLSSSSINHLRLIKREQEDKNTCRPILRSYCCPIHNDYYGQASIDATRLASCPRKCISAKSQNFGIDGMGLHATSNMNSALWAELYRWATESVFKARH